MEDNQAIVILEQQIEMYRQNHEFLLGEIKRLQSEAELGAKSIADCEAAIKLLQKNRGNGEANEAASN